MKRHLRIVIMASGLSRRFGENKLLVKVKGRPMYSPVLENVSAFLRKNPDKATGIVVSSYEEILSYGRNLGLNTVFNENPEKGQSESIKLGLSFSLDKDGERRESTVFLTADQPWMRQETLEKFLLEVLETKAGFLCASVHGVPGNPVSFEEAYYPELMALQGDYGGKNVMKSHLRDVVYMEIDGDELRDVDQQKDLI